MKIKILAVAALAASSALASEVTVTLTGVNGVAVGGFDASPYTATIDGMTYQVWCDDVLDTVAIGDTWQATVGGTGKFPAADYPALFALAAEDTPANYADIQAAMWELTSGFAGDSAATSLLLDAEAHPYTGDAFNVVAPVDGAHGQEFIVDAVPVVTPEPPAAAMLLIGGGLVAVRLRRRA